MKKIPFKKTVITGLILSCLLLTGNAFAGKPFTIAVIPDTQNYVDSTKPADSYEVYIQQMKYLADNRKKMNLAFVTFVGDLVQHGDGTNGSSGDTTYGAGLEWVRFIEGIDILSDSGVPFGASIGNHDYDNYSYLTGSRPLSGVTFWNRLLGSGSPYFADKKWYGGASDEMATNPGISSYQLITSGDTCILHISLEMEAGDSALAWAQEVIDTHPGCPTIVTTHSYLSPPAENDDNLPLAVPAARNTASYLINSPGGWNDAQTVWDTFISKNDQIFMVLCGHAFNSAVNGVSKSENIRIDMNDAGHPVYQLLTDYQGNTAGGSVGGDGWLRLMEFDMQHGTIHFRTYSTLLHKYAGLNGEKSFNQAPEFSDFSLKVPLQARNPSGTRSNCGCRWNEDSAHHQPGR